MRKDQPAPGELLSGAPSYAAALMRAFAVQGPLPNQLHSDLVNVIKLADLTLPEYWWLQRGRRFNAGYQQAAVAGQQGFIAMLGQSQTLAVVDKIILGNPVAALGQFLIGIGSSPGAGAQTTIGSPADDRHNNQTRFFFNLGTNAAPVIPANSLLLTVPGNSSLVVEGPWVLTNAHNLCVINATVNQALQANFFWRERDLLQTETA